MLGHFHEISKAQLEPHIPSDAEDGDFPIEMADFEKIVNARHPSSLPPTATLRGICPASAICTRALISGS
jgi:hypothetical protein